MLFGRKQLPLLVVAAGYVLAVGVGIWLAKPACFAPPWAHPATFILLGVAVFAVAFLPRPSLVEVPLRLAKAAGLVAVVVLVRVFATPLFPGIDYPGPTSIDSYLFNVQLQWHNSFYFGSCSGLLRPGEVG